MPHMRRMSGRGRGLDLPVPHRSTLAPFVSAALSLAARRSVARMCGFALARWHAWCWPRSRPCTFRWSTATQSTRCRPKGGLAGNPATGADRTDPRAYGLAARRLRRLRRVARRGVRGGAAAYDTPGRAADTSATCTGCRCGSTSTGRRAACRASIERGVQGTQQVLRLAVFNVLPTIFEVPDGHRVIWNLFDWRFAAWSPSARWPAISASPSLFTSTGGSASAAQMNEVDSEANTKALDSLLNYETVKYFGNEGARGAPVRRRARPLRDGGRQKPGHAQHAQHRAGVHHRGGLALIMLMAARGVVSGRDDGGQVRAGEHLSDAAVPAAEFPRLRLRLIKQGLVDMEQMFRLLHGGAGGGRPARCARRCRRI